MPDDSSFDPAYSLNAMQMAAGLMPPFATSAPAIPFPGQISAQFAQAGLAGGMGFPSPVPTFTGGPQMMPGPNGVFMPMQMGGPAQAFGASGFGGMGPMTPPSIYTGHGAVTPPPMYRGPMGQPPNMVAPGIASSFFNTPYQANFNQQQATDDRFFAMGMAGYGSAARTATDFGAAGVGAYFGNRFGGAKGAIVGGALGFLGSEFGGLGQAGQNFFMNNFAAPAVNMRGYGAGIQDLSQGFVSSGPFLGANGAGFSRGASINAARMLEDMSNSDSFRKETFNRFNTADVMRITQGGAQNGLMQGASSPESMKERVRDLAKQLQSFMELANEPDLQRAIQTMGNLRSQGLGINETMQAVQNGRAFARMAGTTFENLMNVGGAQGASTLGSMGLTQGLGTRVGMANYGLAAGSQNMAALSPQMMNLMGGAQGLANMNNMFSAGVLQMPMVAPGMMNGVGGINPNSVMALAQGRVDPMSMTSMGANNLGAMTQRMGIGGLGMAVGMQPMLQDTVGRMMQAQGPFAQRTMEDRQVMALASRMGMRGSEGFMTAAQMMGMSGTQAMARAQEMGDPRHFDRMRDQIETHRREQRAIEERAREARVPGVMDTLASNSDLVYGARAGARGLGRGIRDAYESFAGGGPNQFYTANTAEERREMRRTLRSSEYQRHLDAMQHGDDGDRSFVDSMSMNSLVAESRGLRGVAAGLGGVLYGATRSNREREADLRDISEGGRFTASMLNSSAREQNVAARNGALFGGSDTARAGFSTDLANLYNNSQGPTTWSSHSGAIGRGVNNLLVRASSQYLGGMLPTDIGNISGARQTGMRDIRAAYVRSMHGQAGTDAEHGSFFDANSASIATSAAPLTMFNLTDEGRANLEADNARAARVTGAGGNREAGERRAYAGLLGGDASSVRSRRAFDSVDRMFSGFGSTQSQRDASHQLMTTLAILGRRRERPGMRDEVMRQQTAVLAEAQRRGVDTDEALRRVTGRMGDVKGVEGFDDVAQRMNVGGSGAALLDRVRGTHQGAVHAGLDRALGSGADLLGRQRGQLGNLFAGVGEGGEFHKDRLEANIGRVNLDELAEQNPAMARAVRQFRNGNARQRDAAMAAIQSRAIGDGEQFQRREQEAQALGRSGRWNEGWSRGRGFNALFQAARGFLESDSDWARDRSKGGTRADDEAARQSGDVTALQTEAEGAGMGGAGDALLRASRSLEDAARSLERSTQSGVFDSLFGENK